MEIREINTLQGLRRVFGIQEEEREKAFKQQILELLRPLLEQSMRYMPSSEEEDPLMAAARTMKLYTPEMGAERALAALDELERADAWRTNVAALKRAIDALQPEQHGIPLEHVHFAFTLADPEGLGEEGYTGSGNVPGWVILSAWPKAHNLPKLPAIVVHELNHNVRFQFEPMFPMTLGQYMVAEGLAEAFAAELCGEEMLGPWATTLRGAELDALKPRFREALNESDFNVVRGYIFGDSRAADFGYAAQGIPDYAGYAMGYHTVQIYLERTGKSAAEATYVPWKEIVEVSGALGQPTAHST